MSTVSAAVMAEIGVAMLEGAAKYGRHNYRAVGVQSSVYYDATMRHLMAWWEGEDTDPDSGMSHITKAITSLVVLRDAMIQGKLSDDRPPCSADFYPRLNALAAEVLDRHADKAPVHYTQARVASGKCCGQPETCISSPCVPREQALAGDDGWIVWLGGDCPVPGKVEVEIRRRDLRTTKCLAGHFRWLWASKDQIFLDPLGDIVAYRIVEPSRG